MAILKFKCTLCSDVILNQKAYSEGPNQTHDYIPGSCFWGIVATYIYKNNPELAMDVVHSGNVRFGDAHPSVGAFRSNKAPLAFFYPKLSDSFDELYVYHGIKDTESLRGLQLKQCRSGYYNFSSTEAQKVEVNTNFAVKSAYDSETRRSEDEKLFQYESLQQGLELYFSVEVDNPDLKAVVTEALSGRKHVGRSKSAEYGLVEVEPCDFKEVDSVKSDDGLLVVYADSRLVFLDENAEPHYRPEPSDFGVQDSSAAILWDKSQVRTFQYAPWNSKRHTFDSERCGFEKGSVIVIRTAESPSENSAYIGAYRGEGFGRVIFNPEFLKYGENGRSKCHLTTVKKDASTPKVCVAELKGTSLLDFLYMRKVEETQNLEVYNVVNAQVEKWLSSRLFKGDAFASQWGSIRKIAMVEGDKNRLLALITEYLSHGVAKDRWSARGRRTQLLDFIHGQREEICQKVVINLSSEMAKKCKE